MLFHKARVSVNRSHAHMPHRIAPVARPRAAAHGADLEDVVLAGDEGADGHVARFAVQASVLPGALRLAGGGEGEAGFVVARVFHHLDFDDELGAHAVLDVGDGGSRERLLRAVGAHGVEAAGGKAGLP
jgi:hypothetical protein